MRSDRDWKSTGQNYPMENCKLSEQSFSLSLSLPPSLLVFVVGANTTEENTKINVFFIWGKCSGHFKIGSTNLVSFLEAVSLLWKILKFQSFWVCVWNHIMIRYMCCVYESYLHSSDFIHWLQCCWGYS